MKIIGIYNENKLRSFINDEIETLRKNCTHPKIKYQYATIDEMADDMWKNELINKVYDFWTTFDLGLIKQGKRLSSDYKKLSLMKNEIDEIIFDKEERLIIGNEKIATKLLTNSQRKISNKDKKGKTALERIKSLLKRRKITRIKLLHLSLSDLAEEIHNELPEFTVGTIRVNLTNYREGKR